MGVWTRTQEQGLTYSDGHFKLAAISPGDTLIRVHMQWGLVGTSTLETSIAGLGSNLITMGLVTTVGDGTETPPAAQSASSDANPPTERWIYWETRTPVVSAISKRADLVAWRDSGPQEAVDTKGMVSAKTVPAGQYLNLWASWQALGGWTPTGEVNIWFSASVFSQPAAA